MPDIKAILDVPPADFAAYQFTLAHEKFVLNRTVVASYNGKSQNDVVFERLTNSGDSWVICVRKPKDTQWRFFGRFVAPGLFVALLPKRRSECGTVAQYAICITEFQALWLQVMGPNSWMTGPDCEAYFGERVSDVDDI